MLMIDIMPVHVREWATGQKTHGVRPATIAKSNVILSAIFTTAPCKGVKTPPVLVKPRTWAPPSATCTPCPMPTKPPSTPWPRSEAGPVRLTAARQLNTRPSQDRLNSPCFTPLRNASH
jgi:hypothetical protein